MTRRVALSSLGLGVAYALLTGLVTPYANYLIKIPDWWYPTFGQGNATALTWLHLMNGLFLAICTLPISLAIACLFPTAWKSVSIGVGITGSLLIWIPAFSLVLSGALEGAKQVNVFFLSTAIDVAKYSFFPIVFTALIRKAVPSNNALHEHN